MMVSKALRSGAFAILAWLTGCQNHSNQDAIEGGGFAENAPPKPPNCPQTPELRFVTLSDGSIADVRIIQIGGKKLYLPSNWVKRSFVDLLTNPHGIAGGFDPDIHSQECPGVVHSFVEAKPGNNRFIPIISIHLDRMDSLSGLTSDDVLALHITKNTIRPEKGLQIAKAGGFFDHTMVPSPEILVFLSTEYKSSSGNVSSASLLDLFHWLETPPAKRNNGKQFKIAIDETTAQLPLRQLDGF